MAASVPRFSAFTAPPSVGAQTGSSVGSFYRSAQPSTGYMTSRGVRGVRVYWDEVKIHLITEDLPVVAHNAAADIAAKAAGAVIGPAYRSTGNLRKDVENVKRVSDKVAFVGSSLVYANIQDKGGRIVPKNSEKLLIHGFDSASGFMPQRRGPAGSDVAGQFIGQGDVRSADAVEIPGKHYLDVVGPTYVAACIASYAQGFPP